MENETSIQVVGKTPIDGKINIDNELGVAFKRMAVSKIIKNPTNNSTNYQLKNLDEITVISGDKIVKGVKKKHSQSQVLRNRIFTLWEQQASGSEDFDVYYAKTMSEIIQSIEDKIV